MQFLNHWISSNIKFSKYVSMFTAKFNLDLIKKISVMGKMSFCITVFWDSRPSYLIFVNFYLFHHGPVSVKYLVFSYIHRNQDAQPYKECFRCCLCSYLIFVNFSLFQLCHAPLLYDQGNDNFNKEKFYDHSVKFRYSEKALKIWKTLPIFLNLLSNVK